MKNEKKLGLGKNEKKKKKRRPNIFLILELIYFPHTDLEQKPGTHPL